MSKRYRNSFKRTLCRCKNIPMKSAYRNGRSYTYYNRDSARFPRTAYTTTPFNRTTNKSSSQNQYRDIVFTFSIAKYKLVIGSRTFSRHNEGSGECHRRTSLHYRLSFTERKEREEEKEKMKLQLQQRKFSLNFIQQPKQHRARFIFTTSLPPLTPPNSSISESKTFSQLQNSFHTKPLSKIGKS